MATSGYPMLDANDLAAFIQSTQQQSLTRALGRGIEGVNLQNVSPNPWASASASFMQGFLGGLANAYSSKQETDQLNAAMKAIPSLSMDPQNTAVPEGVDPTAFSILRTQASLKAGQRDALTQQARIDANIDAQKAGTQKYNEVIGENKAYLDLMKPEGKAATLETLVQDPVGTNPDGSVMYDTKLVKTERAPASNALANPNNPIYKEQQRVTERGQDLNLKTQSEVDALPITKVYVELTRQMATLDEALKQDSPTAAVAAIYSLAKVLDPTAVVRESDFTVVADPGSPALQLNSALQQLKGQGRLVPEMKQNIKALMGPILNANYNAYTQAANLKKESLRANGGNPETVQLLPRLELAPSVSAGGMDFAAAAKAEKARRASMRASNSTGGW